MRTNLKSAKLVISVLNEKKPLDAMPKSKQTMLPVIQVSPQRKVELNNKLKEL
jgi:hypothetical protein